jgi:hypothetical protein
MAILLGQLAFLLHRYAANCKIPLCWAPAVLWLLQLLLLPVLQGKGVTFGHYGMKPFPEKLGVIENGKIRQAQGFQCTSPAVLHASPTSHHTSEKWYQCSMSCT